MPLVFKGHRPTPDALAPVPPLLAEHAKRWQHCERCELFKNRTRTVLFRGDAPCDLLFIGEGPGDTEDHNGLPFTGIAGHMLDTLTEDIPQLYPDMRVGISNVVACFPHRKDEVGKRIIVPPKAVECRACMPRLQELIDLVQPRMLVALGVPAFKYMRVMKLHTKFPLLPLVHPSAILRAEESIKGIEMKRFMDKLFDFIAKWE